MLKTCLRYAELQYHLLFHFVSKMWLFSLNKLNDSRQYIHQAINFLLFAIRFKLPWLYMGSIDNLAINYIENKREAHIVRTLLI